MAARDRIIEVIYRLKDLFSRDVGKVTSSFEKVDRQSETTSKNIEQRNQRLARSFRGLATATAGALATGGVGFAGLRAFAEELDRVQKAAGNLDITTESLSRLEFAAELSGASAKQLNTALQRLARTTSEAASGNETLRETFAELGLNAAELEQLAIDEQFIRVADALSQIPSASDRVRLSFDLFGRSGANLINLTSQGSQSIRELGDELDRLGGTVTQEAANSAAEFNDALTRLNRNVDALQVALGQPFIVGLNEVFEGLGLGAEENIEAITEELNELNERRKDLLDEDRNIIDALFGPSQAQRLAEIEELDNRVESLFQRRIALSNAEQQAIDNNEELAKRQSEVATESENISRAVTQATTALQNQNKELEQARTFAAETRDRFKELFEEITAPDVEADVGVLDVFNAISRAQEALRAGDNERAVEILGQGGEALRALKEQGDVAGITLQDLATSLQRIAAEAAEAELQEELINTQQSQQQLEQLENRKKALEEGGINIKTNLDTTELDEFTPEEVIVPVRFEIVGGVPALTDGTDVTAREATKRGFRP